jgi:hypothetical protein
MRCWDEVGMSTGQPAWQADPPSVLVNQDGESLEAESSTPRRRPKTDQESTHPLEETTDSATSNTLSPPLPSSKAERSKQKRREDASWPSEGNLSPTMPQGRQASPLQQQQQQQQQRKPPPAPAAPLDLPTIDDVRAAHAAAMASQRKSGTYHYDVERGRPPAGMGGMGMGMGVASTATAPHYASRYSHRQRMPKDVHISMNPKEEDGLELENRTSTDVLNPRNRNSSTSIPDDTLVDQSKSSSMDSPRTSMNATRTNNNGRTLYSSGTTDKGDTVIENLIDATSATDLNATSEARSSVKGNFISSPLASQSPVFSSMQDESLRDESNPSAAPVIAS